MTWNTRGLKEDPHAWWSKAFKLVLTNMGLTCVSLGVKLGLDSRVVSGWKGGKIPRYATRIGQALEQIGAPRSVEGSTISVALEQAQAASVILKSTLCAPRAAQSTTGNNRTVIRMEKARERSCIRCSARTQFRTTDGQPLCPLCAKEDPLADRTTT